MSNGLQMVYIDADARLTGTRLVSLSLPRNIGTKCVPGGIWTVIRLTIKLRDAIYSINHGLSQAELLLTVCMLAGSF